MNPIMYFTTFVAVVTLFASFVAVSGWASLKLFQAARRACRRLRHPEVQPKPQPQIEFEGWHPAHLKRAGQ